MQKLYSSFCIAHHQFREGTKTNKYVPLTKAKNKLYLFAVELVILTYRVIGGSSLSQHYLGVYHELPAFPVHWNDKVLWASFMPPNKTA